MTLGENATSYLLNKELTAAADASQDGPLQTKYGNLYAACTDTSELTDKLGTKPIAPELAAIDCVGSDKKKLAQLDVMLRRTGSAGFAVSFWWAWGRTRRIRASRFCRPARAA